MVWWQTLIVALSTIVVTKGLDLLISWLTQKREFNRFRREKITEEIEALKNEVGKLFELAANWKSFEEKQRTYLTNFQNDHELVGKFNKYPSIAQAARDTVHWCGIVASCEMRQTHDLIENKKELGEKFKKFLTVCDDYLNRMI